jgi:hypothetical protein
MDFDRSASESKDANVRNKKNLCAPNCDIGREISRLQLAVSMVIF